MTKIYIVKDLEKDKYYLYINALGMGELESMLAERFIKAYSHVAPDVIENAIQWTFYNP